MKIRNVILAEKYANIANTKYPIASEARTSALSCEQKGKRQA